MFNYFVSYSAICPPHINCFGSCVIKTDIKISSYEDINELQRLIEKKTNKPENSVVILNFILLN